MAPVDEGWQAGFVDPAGHETFLLASFMRCSFFAV